MIKNFTTLFCLILVLAASSCKKIDSTADVDKSYISIINASSSLGTYNFYMNNSKANAAALPTGGVINYLELAAGAYDTKFTTASSTESVLSKTLNLNINTVYSYFLIGEPDQLETVIATDVMTAANSKASVRFVNMTPDAESLNLIITKSAEKDEVGESVELNMVYKSVSEFGTYDPAKYTFEVREKSTNKFVATLSGITVTAGKYYTIMVAGKINSGNTERSAAVHLITNL